ncbi:hypothetical protein [Enterococcus hirae]|uniref:hypothetical protein n=1 Tax=Enterococcus hirae TaxID=1354 RepID=UPI001A976D3B|nr:hypothetical protein [Enterococcus hirae]MBO1133976.1 hypothetical protein [Enterococcus hirae]
MPNKEQEKTKTIQQEPTELNSNTTKEKENSPFISKKRAEEKLKNKLSKKEDKAVKQEIKTVMKDADRTQDPSQIFKYLTYGLEHNPFISKERAEEELKKFKGKYRKKEDKAVEQVIAKVMKNRAIPRSSVLRYLKNELKKSPHISRQRVVEEMGKYEGGNNVRNSSEVPVNKDRRENIKEKLNRVSKEENSSPKRAAVSQDLQHKQDNPLHR